MRWRVLVPVLLTLAILLVVVSGPREDAPEGGADADDTADDEKLRIRWLNPVELEPGEAVIVDVSGIEGGGAPGRARISTPEDEKIDTPLLHEEGGRWVVRIPPDAPTGQVKLRVFQGEGADERKSKPRHLQLHRRPFGAVLRDTLGGLALFALGLLGLGRALRGYAGLRVRERAGRLTASVPGALGLGALLGGLLQSTTAGAAVVAGLLGARMLSETGALTLLLGVQLGAAAAGALLPFFVAREALWLVLLGAVCIGVAGDRRMEALGNIVLGVGVVLLGLRLSQEGLRPLVSDPALLPYLHEVRVETPSGATRAVGLGALLGAVLQGPGPVFAVTSSMARTSGLLGLGDGLAILSGTALGAALGTLLVGSAFGRAGARLACSHAWLGLVMTAVMLFGSAAWEAAARSMIAGAPSDVSLAGHVLHPAMAGHLAAAFVTAQVVSVLVAVALRASAVKWAARWIPERSASVRPAAGPGPAPLAPALDACRRALLALAEIVRTREREPAVTAEGAIGEARASVEALLRGTATNPRAASACLHLVSATEATLDVAEQALARDFAAETADVSQLAALHNLVVEGIDALLAFAREGALLELEGARAREIHLNALAEIAAGGNGEGIRAGAGPAHHGVAYRLWFAELALAYEAVGNQLYRMTKTLADEA